ncbi:phosphoinositide-3-kinase regulatory subunit 4, partial [Biomphalaria glabrata]
MRRSGPSGNCAKLNETLQFCGLFKDKDVRNKSNTICDNPHCPVTCVVSFSKLDDISKTTSAMGNQLTGEAPAIIYPVEHYLTDIPHYEFDCSLGSTRFFKVVRARCKEGLVVVRIFVIQGSSVPLPLKEYQDRLDVIYKSLKNLPNCLPFQKHVKLDRAAFLIRQYIKYSLYDRLSTRPFLTLIEKRWIAFQLLCALNQCHKVQVCHGDIKAENILLTGWNWLLLTDFASFKPTSLPYDNPADFSYFFDTSRRRVCYIAPERFIGRPPSEKNSDGSLDESQNKVYKELTPAMDIFSAGCVIIELFCDGTPPFDLSQLLNYSCKNYSPWKLIDTIPDNNIKDLVEHMTQRKPEFRLSAEEYLIKQRGKAFPEYFYTFFKTYTHQFATVPILPSDDRILILNRDLDHILANMDLDDKVEKNSKLVLVISLVTSVARDLHFSNFRLLALKLMLRLSKYVTSDIILDRILPHMLYFTQDPLPEVRAETIRTVTACIRNLKSVPRNDANVFQDYIIPALSPLLSDEVLQVRLTFAENIAELADTAVKYLDMAQAQEIREVIVQLKDQQRDKASISETVINVKKTAEELKPEIQEVESNYDMELHQLKDLIHQKIFQLLSDPNHAVKMTLMANGMDKLCLFFGRQKANDILLSHIVTFLNVKDDWRLRACFFKTVVDVTMYVGWQCSEVLLPLLQQGLYDVEEFVITEDLLALKKLTNHRLLNKIMMQTLVCDAAALLAHPGPWIRQAAVGFITAVAQAYDIPDIHCKLLPQLKPFLSRNVMQLRKPAVVLDALSDPIPREVFDYLLRSPLLESVYEVLAKLQKYARSISRQARNPELDESLSQVFRKLTSLGLTEEFEKKLLAMKDFMLRLHKNKTGSSESIHKTSIHSTPGNINIAVFGRGITRRHADLHKNRDSGDVQAAAAAGKNRKPKKQDSVIMNPEWKKMFGNDDPDATSLSSSPKANSSIYPDRRQSETSLKTPLSTAATTPVSLLIPFPFFSDTPHVPLFIQLICGCFLRHSPCPSVHPAYLWMFSQTLPMSLCSSSLSVDVFSDTPHVPLFTQLICGCFLRHSPCPSVHPSYLWMFSQTLPMSLCSPSLSVDVFSDTPHVPLFTQLICGCFLRHSPCPSVHPAYLWMFSQTLPMSLCSPSLSVDVFSDTFHVPLFTQLICGCFLRHSPCPSVHPAYLWMFSQTLPMSLCSPSLSVDVFSDTPHVPLFTQLICGCFLRHSSCPSVHPAYLWMFSQTLLMSLCSPSLSVDVFSDTPHVPLFTLSVDVFSDTPHVPLFTQLICGCFLRHSSCPSVHPAYLWMFSQTLPMSLCSSSLSVDVFSDTPHVPLFIQLICGCFLRHSPCPSVHPAYLWMFSQTLSMSLCSPSLSVDVFSDTFHVPLFTQLICGCFLRHSPCPSVHPAYLWMFSQTLPMSLLSPIHSSTDSMSQVLLTSENFQRALAMSQSQEKSLKSVITRYAKCKWELRDLVHHRRAQFEADILLTDAISGIAWDTHHPPDTWKPKGVLVAHLQEHRGAINRLSVSHDHKYFASCSNDGTVRIWESGKLEGKTAANRSKVCLNKQGGKIKCVTFLERGNSVASASDNNSIHVYRLDGGSVQLEDSRTVDVRTYGQIMDMTHFDTGAQSILTYATVSSHIIGWDLRSSNPAWTLHNDPRHGLITSFAVNQSQCWLAAGTSSGALVCWDMRFRMPINKMQHASGRKVRRLTMHPSEQSLLVASFNWNNEVSMWDAETGQRQRTLWPSSSPALSYTKLNKTREDDGICSIYVGSTDTKTFVLTGGTDMRLRFWDLSYPANSMCFNYGLDDPRTLSLNYRSQLIEGSEVIQELETQREPLDKYETEREMHLMHSAPLLGHHDIVNDLTLCHSTQTLVISAARNGHIKVW